MKEVLELIIKSLVDDSEAVSIEEIITEKNINLKVRVANGDMGKVIGKQGKIAKSIRTLAKSLSAKDGKRVNIEFID
ncbi:MAG TPA: KH domain-containing protein [Clostridia bacterium]|nr:KH domain-containing protein [Clostridia bacterium]